MWAKAAVRGFGCLDPGASCLRSPRSGIWKTSTFSRTGHGPLGFTSREFGMLWLLLQHAGNPILGSQVWEKIAPGDLKPCKTGKLLSPTPDQLGRPSASSPKT